MIQMYKDSHMIWKNEIYTIESIIDKTLWDRTLINNFQKHLSPILNEIYKISYLINANKKIYVSLSFAGDKKITELNDIYRKKNLPTNVLAFPSLQKRKNKIFLGDIIFSAASKMGNKS